ncbi:hypothetical protein GCM10023151_15160 [Kangiella marina]|uniref:Uncharacterized protein n=1 Tax=Kangiella marina TaxID=1079178 RepID=A0ABP8IKN2_9GAMM
MKGEIYRETLKQSSSSAEQSNFDSFITRNKHGGGNVNYNPHVYIQFSIKDQIRTTLWVYPGQLGQKLNIYYKDHKAQKPEFFAAFSQLQHTKKLDFCSTARLLGLEVRECIYKYMTELNKPISIQN